MILAIIIGVIIVAALVAVEAVLIFIVNQIFNDKE